MLHINQIQACDFTKHNSFNTLGVSKDQITTRWRTAMKPEMFASCQEVAKFVNKWDFPTSLIDELIGKDIDYVSNYTILK